MKYVRDHVQYPVPETYFQQKIQVGWRLRAIEWERDERAEIPGEDTRASDVPYGLEIAAGALDLVQSPREIAVLLTILEMIVKDQNVPAIAAELNRRQFTNQQGQRWSAPAVFDLLPRVIEMGPALLQSDQWRAMRPTVTA